MLNYDSGNLKKSRNLKGFNKINPTFSENYSRIKSGLSFNEISKTDSNNHSKLK